MEVLPCFNELLSTAKQNYFDSLQMTGKMSHPKSLPLRVKLEEFILHPLSSVKPQYSCVYPE